MKSKWIALVLAAVLCVGSVPVWAEESADKYFANSHNKTFGSSRFLL